ncbi:GDSL-type esterase/lipase family protein [Anaerotruncus rubiinfantis]|uniref:GDSL-type esterase/lipase family protein n=1 Tax=Anaerotruncus rubiinfantis TaxID=1720200 RepID=UPI00082DD204|nr:GDSL-type esterase/lipase family protein [Anaerotruncus rubiinfantis]
MSDRPIKINRGPKKNSIWPVLGLIGAAIAIALIIAFVWQSMAGGAQAQSSGPSSSPASSSSPPPSTPEESSAAPSSSEPEEEELLVFDGAVPESERVKSTYFDDAVFVGDSITTGIDLYGVMKNTDVLADTGVNLGSVYTKEAVKQEDGTRIPIMDALGQKQYAKVYIMLGGNEVRDEDQQTFISRYGKLIDDVREIQPNALVYVQSILPVTLNNQYNMNNDKIDTFNAALLELCKEKGVYYLNVAEKFKDENGRLPDAASPADGMHFGPDYYQIWFTYLKTHVVGMPPAASSEPEDLAAETSSSFPEPGAELETVE